ncbi:MAG: aminopeptidase [Chloroflexi bacterium]|nr:aminopeptidase [Chloroflexota bacterium]
MTLIDPRVSKQAEVIVDYCVKFQKGERAMLRFGFLGLPLLYEVYRLLLQRGAAEVVFQPELGEEDLLEIFLRNTTSEQRQTLPRIYDFAIHNVDCFIILDTPRNTHYASGLDPDHMSEYFKTLKPITDYRVRHTRWLVTQFPTEALAQDADMSLSDYENFLFSAINDVDWPALAEQQETLRKRVDATKQVRILGEGTDLIFSISGRAAESAAGKVNMPDGEVFTSVVENSANGHIQYTFPAIHYGKEFHGVTLEFEDGKVVKATASKGEEELNKILDQDEGARRIGEFGIGNNFAITKFAKNILFDEKIGGTIHLALGQGYEETKSENKSTLHWDMIKDLRTNGELWLDDELVQKNGQWLIKL